MWEDPKLGCNLGILYPLPWASHVTVEVHAPQSPVAQSGPSSNTQPNTAMSVSAPLPPPTEAAAAPDHFLSSDAGEGPFLGLPSSVPSPDAVSFSLHVMGEEIQVVEETPQASSTSATAASDSFNLVAVAEAAVVSQ